MASWNSWGFTCQLKKASGPSQIIEKCFGQLSSELSSGKKLGSTVLKGKLIQLVSVRAIGLFNFVQNILGSYSICTASDRFSIFLCMDA